MQRRIAGYRARIGRDELIVKTVEKGIEIIPFFYPLRARFHTMAPYKICVTGRRFYVAEKLSSR